MKGLAVLVAGGLLFVSSAFSLAASHTDENQETSIFQIGTFDRSSAEFGVEDPKAPVVFDAGKSKTSEWPAAQPAELDSENSRFTMGDRAARTIVFSLRDAPRVQYRLHVAVLLETPSVPALQVNINGQVGRFYLEPKLDFESGDQVASFDPSYSHADVVFVFPGGYLHQGANTLTLQAIEEASMIVPDAGITYDAVEMTTAAGSTLPGGSIKIAPTIFYQQQKGNPEELVDVYLQHSIGDGSRGSLTLSIGGHSYHHDFHSIREFGQERVEFSVTEFPPGSVAIFDGTIGSQHYHVRQVVDPARKWEMFLVPHIHLDIGYTDYQAKVSAVQSRVIDEALDLMKIHPEFRFSIDGQWNLEQFMSSRAPAEQARAIAAIRSQKLYIPAQYANLLTGFAGEEALIRSLYAGAKSSKQYGSKFDYANLTDVPSYSWSYASILASAGIKDFLAASNNYRAPVLLRGNLHASSPMWWEGPDGKKVLLWYSRHYMQMQFLFGLPPVIAAGRDTLPVFLETYSQSSYKSNRVIVFGTQVENTDLFPQQASLVSEWNAAYAYPRMQYAGVHEALESIAAQFGDDLPVIRGDGGPYWEDGNVADAYYAAMERNNEIRALSSEKLETVASLINSRIAPDKAGLDQLWKNIVLMDEHTSTSFNSVTDPTSEEAREQLAVKHLYAMTAQDIADRLARTSMATVVNSISVGQGGLVVFNTLNWQRSGMVTFDLPESRELIDLSTNDPVPTELIAQGNHFRRVRFLARDVPPVGYKVFLERKTDKPQPAQELTSNTVLENRFYRVQLDPASGAILSVYDKELKRDIVNKNSPYRLGQYLYVTGGDPASSSILHYRQDAPEPKLEIHSAAQGKLISAFRTPYGEVAHMRSSAENTPQIDTEIRLPNERKEIEFVEDVTKTETYAKEAAYFAFPFAMNHPEFRYEIQNGTVDPATDMYPGAGREWFSVQHWVALQQSGLSAAVFPLDAPLATLGDINRGAWPTEFGARPGTIFSYVMNNYWDTNYPAGQGGQFHFRYAVTSAPATNAQSLSRMGWEEATSLERDEVTAQDKAITAGGVFNEKMYSFLNVDDPALLLQTWKPAEDGNGTILRFVDLDGTERKVRIRIPLLRIQEAWKTDAVERDLLRLVPGADSGLEFTIHPHEIATIRIEGQRVSQVTH
jgi:alpha-mannosidase